MSTVIVLVLYLLINLYVVLSFVFLSVCAVFRFLFFLF